MCKGRWEALYGSSLRRRSSRLRRSNNSNSPRRRYPRRSQHGRLRRKYLQHLFPRWLAHYRLQSPLPCFLCKRCSSSPCHRLLHHKLLAWINYRPGNRLPNHRLANHRLVVHQLVNYRLINHQLVNPRSVNHQSAKYR